MHNRRPINPHTAKTIRITVMAVWLLAAGLIAVYSVTVAKHFFEAPLSPTPFATAARTRTPTLVFSDEFNGTELDSTKWNTQWWWGDYHHLARYLPSNVTVQNGYCRITINHTPSGRYAYTAGIITTYRKWYFQYGRVEMRAKVPQGVGFLSSGWSWSDYVTPGGEPWEIDNFQTRGRQTNQTTPAIVWKVPDQVRHETGQDTTMQVNLNEDFHLYVYEWNANSVTWWVDGVQIFSVNANVQSNPLYLIFSTEVGVGDGAWTGLPDGTTPFPSYFDIDYVRVYQY